MIDLLLPRAKSRHRIIILVKSPVEKIGRCSNRHMDTAGVPFLGVGSVGIPCAIVLNESRVREIVEGESRPVLLKLVAVVFIWLRSFPIVISVFRKAIDLCEIDGEGNNECCQGQSEEPQSTEYPNLTSSPWSGKEAFLFCSGSRFRFQGRLNLAPI